MSDRDAFSEARAEAVERRRGLEDARRDVEAMVREEVRRAGVPEGRLREMVDGMVGEALAGQRRAARPAAPGWVVPTLVAAGLVAGLGLGAAGYAVWLGRDGPAPGEGVAAAGAGVGGGETGGAEAPAPAPPPPTPAERAAVYDSLWEARSGRFAALMGRLEEAGPAAPVTAALATWRGGGALNGAATRRLHDALVQLSLNEMAGAGLSLDGLLSRGPCRGNSCGALLDLWRSRGDALGMPPVPPDPTTDDATLRVVERLLVLSVLEGP